MDVTKGDETLDCRIELRDGSILNIASVDDSWYWIDLFEILFDRGDINESEFDYIEAEIAMDLTVQPMISFLEKTNSGLRNLDATDKVPLETKPLLRKEKNATSDGLKRRTSTESQPPGPKPNSGGLKRRTSTEPQPLSSKPESGGLKRSKKIQQPAPLIPEPKIPQSSNLGIKRSSTQSSVVSSYSNSMPVKCSKNGSDWTAVLVSEHKPNTIKLKPVTSTSKFTSTIHLVLDDSGSMDGEPNRQLIAAAQSFLSERPLKENIVLHTFNNSLNGAGNPSSIASLVARLSCPGHTPMCSCLSRVAKHTSSGDIIIFFSDGGSTDGDPSGEASMIKKSGVRFITIGCGSGVNVSLMKKLASSKSDFHMAKNASGILQAFQAVAKSLQQQNLARSPTNKNSNSGISALQINSYGSLPHSQSAGTVSSSNILGDNEGYDFIEQFSCHHCSSTDRIACIFCGKNTCGGGTVSGILKCPFCHEESEVEITKKGVRAGTQGLGGKGKK